MEAKGSLQKCAVEAQSRSKEIAKSTTPTNARVYSTVIQ